MKVSKKKGQHPRFPVLASVKRYENTMSVLISRSKPKNQGDPSPLMRALKHAAQCVFESNMRTLLGKPPAVGSSSEVVLRYDDSVCALRSLHAKTVNRISSLSRASVLGIYAIVLLTGCAWGQTSGAGTVVVNGSNGKGVLHIPCDAIDPKPDDCPKPEPMDVPAVKFLAKNGDVIGHVCAEINTNFCNVLVVGKPRKIWACADKRRILLTSEDGQKHCILFPPQAK